MLHFCCCWYNIMISVQQAARLKVRERERGFRAARKECLRILFWDFVKSHYSTWSYNVRSHSLTNENNPLTAQQIDYTYLESSNLSFARQIKIIYDVCLQHSLFCNIQNNGKYISNSRAYKLQIYFIKSSQKCVFARIHDLNQRRIA